jgi:hypothetical protein
MVKSCLRERLKRSILHILLNKQPSLVAGQSQQLLGTEIPGILRGGFRGKYRNSWPTGIHAKNSCDSEKKRNSSDLSKTTFL